jgi:DNA polymerase-4
LHSFTRQKKLDFSTNITKDILNASMELFVENCSFDKNIRSLGVSVTDFEVSSCAHQTSIFVSEEEIIKNEHLDNALDIIKNRFGNCAVKPAKLMFDRELSGFNPKEDHIVHPVGYF